MMNKKNNNKTNRIEIPFDIIKKDKKSKEKKLSIHLTFRAQSHLFYFFASFKITKQYINCCCLFLYLSLL